MRPPRSGWKGAFLGLALAALLPAALSAWLHPRAPLLRLPELPEIGAEAATRLPDAVWVDARPPEAFAKGHIPQAVSLPAGRWDESIDPLLDRWEPGRPLVVYCSRDDCDAGRTVATRLRRELGEENRIYLLRGGWEAWHHP